MKIQKGLAELGYNPGEPDGQMGPMTSTAIREFQNDNGFPVDGKESGWLLFQVESRLEVVRAAATPEGQQRKRERELLLALPFEELEERILGANKEEAEKIIELMGEDVKRIRASVLMSAWSKEGSETLDALLTLQLRGLFYPDPPKGVSQFQEDIGAPVTGEITFGQWLELQRRWTRLRDSPVHLSISEPRIYSSSGFAQTEGAWIIDNEEIAFPINDSEVTCRRDWGICQVVIAQLSVPRINESAGGYYMTVDVDEYDIISWGESEIVARSESDCRIVLLTMNLNSHETIEIVRNNETQSCRESVVSLPRLTSPRVSRLVSGFSQSEAFWKGREKITREYINPRTRADLIESLARE